MANTKTFEFDQKGNLTVREIGNAKVESPAGSGVFIEKQNQVLNQRDIAADQLAAHLSMLVTEVGANDLLKIQDIIKGLNA